MTASFEDVAPMGSAEWLCVSPHTCVRCSNVHRVVDRRHILRNEFACSCAYDERGTPCPHQQIVDQYKSRITAPEGGSSHSSVPIGDSQPSTSTSTSYRKPNRCKPKRKNQLSYRRASLTTHNVDYMEMKTLLKISQSNISTPLPTNCQFNERLTADWVDRTSYNLAESSASNCSSSSSSSSSSSISSSSSGSSSSSSNGSGSSSSGSTSCNTSSTTGSSTEPTSCALNNAVEPNGDTDEAGTYPTASQIASKVSRRRGYKIMNEEKLENGCAKSDEENCGNSPSASSDSDDSSTSGSTTASSDDSWWQTYEREKDIVFLEKNGLMAKDSGYVSTTSPNTDSTKTDD